MDWGGISQHWTWSEQELSGMCDKELTVYNGLYSIGHSGCMQLKYVCSNREDSSGDTLRTELEAGAGRGGIREAC